MEAQEKQLDFIRLRAENNSYNKISKELSISKDTCSKWEKQLQSEITKHKKDQLEELYTSYFMYKESRITELGESLKAINKALESKDLEKIPAEKLLDYKLKYMTELKKEYIQLKENDIGTEPTPENILKELFSLIGKIRTGEITNDQAMKENYILLNTLKAFETIDLKDKLELLESIVGGRK